MTTDDRIARLEALLARVRSRSRPSDAAHADTKGNGNGAKTRDVDIAAPPPMNPFDVPTPMGAFHPSPLPPPPAAATENKSQPPSAPKYTQRPEAPPLFAVKPVAPLTRAPSDASLDQTLVEAIAPRRRAPEPEPSRVRPIEPPPMEVIELDVDPDPSMPPPSTAPISVAPVSGQAQTEDGLESRSRLVSAPPVAVDSSGVETLDDDDVDDRSDDDDDVEEEEPFALSVPPGHAASDPTIEAAAAEVTQAELDALELDERAPTSSRRPISMEEKMSELEEDSSAHHPPPPASGKLPAATTFDLALEPSFTAPSIASPSLAREALRGEPLAQTEVAMFMGRTPSDVAPKTFGDLLDAALSL